MVIGSDPGWLIPLIGSNTQWQLIDSYEKAQSPYIAGQIDAVAMASAVDSDTATGPVRSEPRMVVKWIVIRRLKAYNQV